MSHWYGYDDLKNANVQCISLGFTTFEFFARCFKLLYSITCIQGSVWNYSFLFSHNVFLFNNNGQILDKLWNE